MSPQLNILQLGKLLNNLHTITGLKFALMDYQAHEVYTSSYINPFCKLVQDTATGYRKCRECDAEHLRQMAPGAGLKQYRCHAGLVEALIPVTDNGQIVAALLLGQLLSEEDIEWQWANTERLCWWYQDMDRLRQEFLKLRQMSHVEIQACSEIAMACVSEVRFQNLVSQSALTDFQRMTMYVDQHYQDKLSLDSLSKALSIGKTKLCNLASREAGISPTRMIAEKRVAVARGMLSGSDMSVQGIAEEVGISDYNYFSKVFKKLSGQTPLGYRKQCRKQ